MSYNYATYEAAMANLLVVKDYATNADWIVILPRMIEYAEQRCYRDLDILDASTTGVVPCVAGTRTVTVPSSILIVESANVITPAATAANSGTRNPLRRMSIEMISYVWPTAGTQGVPQWFTMDDATTMILAPTPDAAYNVEVTGPIIPAPLTSVNTTTYLTTNYPELFIAASMVFGTGWQRDFGAQSEDPQASNSWEQQYQVLIASAREYEDRKKAEGRGWFPMADTNKAQPARGE